MNIKTLLNLCFVAIEQIIDVSVYEKNYNNLILLRNSIKFNNVNVNLVIMMKAKEIALLLTKFKIKKEKVIHQN